jgi:DnaJ-class molecular chaperone
MAENYYVILGVDPEASSAQIRSAYRDRAKAYHPDYYEGGGKPFLEIQEAYVVLSDPARRRAYDREMRVTPRIRTVPRPEGRRRPMRSQVEPIEEITPFQSFQTFGPSREEMSDRYWGNFGGGRHPKSEHLERLTLEVPLTLDQARRGGMARVSVPARSVCPTCGGRGEIGFFDCLRCDGYGDILTHYPVDVRFPAGIRNEYAVQIPLNRFGIRNFHLTVLFRVTATTPDGW